MNTVCCFDKISEKIKELFGRNTKYRRVVNQARAHAKHSKCTTLVYQIGKGFAWSEEWTFHKLLVESNKPVIRLLVCLPDGTVAQ